MEMLFLILALACGFLAFVFTWGACKNKCPFVAPLICFLWLVLSLYIMTMIINFPPESPVIIEQKVLVHGENEINGVKIKAEKYPIKITLYSTRLPWRSDSPKLEYVIENLAEDFPLLGKSAIGTSTTLEMVIIKKKK
jgi:hypothetical protein